MTLSLEGMCVHNYSMMCMHMDVYLYGCVCIRVCVHVVVGCMHKYVNCVYALGSMHMDVYAYGCVYIWV